MAFDKKSLVGWFFAWWISDWTVWVRVRVSNLTSKTNPPTQSLHCFCYSREWIQILISSYIEFADVYVHLKCLVLFLHHLWWERAFRLGKLYSIQQIIVSAWQFFQLTRRNCVVLWMAVVGLSGSHAQNPRSLSQTGKKYETCTLTIPSIQFSALQSVAFYCNLLHWHPSATWEDDVFYSMVLVLVKSIEDCGQ